MNAQQAFATWVRERRLDLGWSMAKLARESERTEATIRNVERCRHPPSALTRRAIENAFKRAELDGQSR